MSEKDWLLTDEFFEFSKKISEIYEHKKKKKEELKIFFEKIQSELKAFEEEANTLSVQFENWKTSYLNLGPYPTTTATKAPTTREPSVESIVDSTKKK